MSLASIFLRELTCVDHAYLTKEGTIHGGSVNVDCIVHGDVTEDEQVVIDFSKCKKAIKSIIDDFYEGYDHKLWLCRGDETEANVETLYSANGVEVNAGKTKIVAPVHMFKIVNTNSYDLEAIAECMSQEVTEKLSSEFPGVTVVITLHENGFTQADNYFRYWHGLKNSSSAGCKRIAHGHLSFFEIVDSRGYLMENVSAIEHQIKEDLNDVVFVCVDNLISDQDGIVEIGYTCAAGDKYYVRLSRDEHTVIVLNTETTIEHIVDFVAEKYNDELLNAGASYIAVSEGLMKGAVTSV